MSNARSTAEVAHLDIGGEMKALGRRAKRAAAELAIASQDQKNGALQKAAAALRTSLDRILEANAIDMAGGQEKGLSKAMLDRLLLNEERVEAMAKGLEDIIALPDPVGSIIDAWDRPNGLHIERIRVPLGVVGIIYESRPNVTADAGALCLKSGNAVILRGGSESFHSSRAIHACLLEGLEAAGLPGDAIQMIPTTDREAVGILLRDMTDTVDIIVPRGGKNLISRVQQDARVPVLAHLEGLCHVYVDKGADIEMAKSLALNSKMRRPGICGAAETLLIDKACVDTHAAPLLKTLIDAGCEVRGDEVLQKINAQVKPVTADDWTTEYLDAIISAGVVDGVTGAIRHITEHGSQHTESIVTNDQATADRFLKQIDSAILLHNASTQYADGGEFGMGAEIGIATGKLHARGPVGLEQLTSFKYIVHGSGQARP